MPYRNKILATLAGADRERLAASMKRVQLNYKEVLIEPNAPIEHVYFVESGVVSLVTDLHEGGVIESGTVGNESMAGTAVLLGVMRTPSRHFVQIRVKRYGCLQRRSPRNAGAADRSRKRCCG